MTEMPPPPPNVLAPASNTPYIVAIVIMVLIGVVAVMMIVLLRPDKDNVQLIATIVGFIVPTTTALMAFMKSQETHLTVNSQLAAWKAEHVALAEATGKEKGVIAEQDRTALIAKTATDAVAAQAVAAVAMKAVMSEHPTVPVAVPASAPAILADATKESVKP